MENKIIKINENNSIIIDYEKEKNFYWANAFLKKNTSSIYLGYYSPELLFGFLEWIEYNSDYVIFFCENIHNSRTFIKKIYDINNEQFIEVKSFHSKELKLKKV